MVSFDRKVTTFIYRVQGWNTTSMYTIGELWTNVYKTLTELPLELLSTPHQSVTAQYKCQYITIASLRTLLEDVSATTSPDGSIWYSVLGTPFLFISINDHDDKVRRYETVLRINRVLGFRDAHLFYENEAIVKNNG